MNKIAIVGSGGLGREILGIIKSINCVHEKWEFIGFYDDNYSSELINGYPIIGGIDDLNTITEELYVIIGIGAPLVKQKIHNKINNKFILYTNLIHPSVVMYSNKYVKLGEGIVIGANCVLTVNISLGNHVYLNTSSVLAHDVSIDDYTMVMPTVSVSAGAKIGKCVFIGNGVKIDYPVNIKDGSIIKTGSILSNL